jgi:hypothetical protein
MMRPESPPTDNLKRTLEMIPQTDLERETMTKKEQHDMASQLLEAIGDILDGVDDTIENLENDSKLLPNGKYLL